MKNATTTFAPSRRKPGSVIHDPDAVVARAVRMVTDRSVVAIDGSVVRLEADTICVHGDNPQALVFVRGLREALTAAGHRVVAFV